MTEKNFQQKFLDTEIVSGHCPECHMYTILVGLTRSYYRCTNCGENIKQYINGRIRYLTLDDRDRQWLKENPSSE